MTTSCIVCEKPAATKVRLNMCWHCYWKSRPEEYKKKQEYNRDFSKRKRDTKYHVFTPGETSEYCVAETDKGYCLLSRKSHEAAERKRVEAVLRYAEKKGINLSIMSEFDELFENAPKPKIRLVGEDGNAYNIMGIAAAGMRKAGWTQKQIDAYREQATSGDYDNLLAVTMKYCDVS